jgi:hypothetical protein
MAMALTPLCSVRYSQRRTHILALLATLVPSESPHTHLAPTIPDPYIVRN